jgi:hypothetical protein
MQREMSVFAALMRKADGVICISIFSVCKDEAVVTDLSVNVIAILDVPRISQLRDKVLDLTQCS